MKTPSTPLGLRIRQARKRTGLNQGEIGRRLAVTGSLISQWEHGYRIPSLMRLKTFAWLCGVDAAWLMFGDSPKSQKSKPTNQGELEWPKPQAPDA